MKIYILERVKASPEWPKGVRIQALRPCKGWRVVKRIYDSHSGGGLR